MAASTCSPPRWYPARPARRCSPRLAPFFAGAAVLLPISSIASRAQPANGPRSRCRHAHVPTTLACLRWHLPGRGRSLPTVSAPLRTAGASM